MLALADATCLRSGDDDGGTLRFREHLFRGGLYEALYRSRFRTPPPGFAALPPLAYRWTDARGATGSRAVSRERAAFGECVVRAGPAESHALLQTEVTRDAEQAAFAALLPHFSACVPAGASLRFSRPVLRGIVAEALYELSVTAQQLQPVP